jgi:hypothetical protein
MVDESEIKETTSRRSFTKSVVATLVAGPIAASIVGCQKSQNQNTATASNQASPPCPTPPTTMAETTGPQIITCDPKLPFEDHIPPMGIDGGGSLRIELRNRLKLQTGGPPFTYLEVDGLEEHDRFGELEKVRVISELRPTPPDTIYVTDVTYFGLPAKSQLLFWYQKVKGPDPGPDDPDSEFDPVPPSGYPDNDPDVRIVGGDGTNFLKITVKHKKLLNKHEKTHKLTRPFRFKHPADGSVPGLGRHFRIGQWRIVGNDGITAVEDAAHNKFESKGADDYRLYVTFGDFA